MLEVSIFLKLTLLSVILIVIKNIVKCRFGNEVGYLLDILFVRL